MAFGIAVMRVLEVMFFTGMAGSAIVVLTIGIRMTLNAIFHRRRPI
jgi:hypothetical protein